jgi:hypothetical protein
MLEQVEYHLNIAIACRYPQGGCKFLVRFASCRTKSARYNFPSILFKLLQVPNRQLVCFMVSTIELNNLRMICVDGNLGLNIVRKIEKG